MVFFYTVLLFIEIDTDMVSDLLLCIENLSNNLYASTAIPLHVFFIGWAAFGFLFGIILNFYLVTVFYYSIFGISFFIIFSVITGECFMMGLMLLYYLVGISGFFYIHLCMFFHREWGLPVEKWRHISYVGTKGSICFIVLLLIYNLKYVLWLPLQLVLTGLVLLLLLLLLLFTLRSYAIIATIQCEGVPREVLALHWKEYLCVVPFIAIWFSYFFYSTPFNITILGGLVSLGPLVCFSFIIKHPSVLQTVLHIVGVLKAKYTTVYIVTLFLVGVVPLFHSMVSIPFTPVLVFLIRLMDLLFLYNREFYLLLKDVMCCKAEYVRQFGAKVIKIGALVWGD